MWPMRLAGGLPTLGSFAESAQQEHIASQIMTFQRVMNAYLGRA